MTKLVTGAVNGRGYEKFGGNYKYVLTDREWNDFGFYTLHELFLITPNDQDNIKLADIRLFNFEQHSNERLNLNTTNYVGFISNIESAEHLLLFLSPNERKELCSVLHINFTAGMFSKQPAFLKSVLRGITVQQFEEKQSKIKAIVTIEENIASMIERNKGVLNIK
ncbi:MAG: hypothetical protein K2N35_08440 [Muribaculaceae bacterium]|nr:hypothetical protein [Muribaculaceae bacterium]